MNVGKDPYPRDEVTGLAAFEHLEPVGTVSVISEKSRETPVLTDSAAISGESASSNSNSSPEPITRPRADATLPLDLSAMGHWAGVHAPTPPAIADEDADTESHDAEEVAFAGAKSTAALDALFEKSAGLDDWEDEDEATRVHSRPAGRGPGHNGDDSELDMEWDDADEPPTETLPFAMLEELPIVARVDADHLEPELDHKTQPRGELWHSGNDDQTSHYLGAAQAATSIRSATPTMRIATPPLHLQEAKSVPPQAQPSAGRPSPFPSSPDRISSYDDDDDDDYDSAFKNLVPLPAPQLPPVVQHQAAPAVRAATPSLLAPAPDAAPAQDEVPARFIDALKAGYRPSVIIAAGGVIGLLALVIIARALALTTNVGTAVLEVSPADAQVQVDGKAVAGTGSPYSVSELKVGSHELQAKKRGYNDYHGNFTINAGQSTKLPVIQLAPNLLDVGFSVRSVPSGAAVWLDGDLTEAITPAKLTGIKPGIHRLALKHEGFSDYELQMFVPEATVLQLPAAELVAVPSPEREPANGKRRTRGASSHGGSSETFATVSARHVSAGYGARSVRHDEPEESSAAPAAASGKTGTLRLNSRPWAQVTVDGNQVGNTPQANLQLSAGKHKLVLSNPQLGVSKNVTVTIKAGETLTQVVNLAE